MSQVQVMTELFGWRGPIFPSNIERLNQLFARSLFHPPVIRECLRALAGFQLTEIITADLRFLDKTILQTQDGYKWLGGLHFTNESGEVMVALPRMNDTRGFNGAPLDRSIALYTKGKVSHQEFEFCFLQLCILWENIADDLWYVNRVKEMSAGGIQNLVVTTGRGPNPSEPAIRSTLQRLGEMLHKPVTYLGCGLDNPENLHFLIFGHEPEIAALRAAGFNNLRVL